MSTAHDDNPYSPPPRDWTDKSWLYEQYWTACLSIDEIADKTEVSRATIRREMQAAGIPRRPRSVDVEGPRDVARVYGGPTATDDHEDECSWSNVRDGALD